jgi:hypothetical protein
MYTAALQGPVHLENVGPRPRPDPSRPIRPGRAAAAAAPTACRRRPCVPDDVLLPPLTAGPTVGTHAQSALARRRRPRGIVPRPASACWCMGRLAEYTFLRAGAAGDDNIELCATLACCRKWLKRIEGVGRMTPQTETAALIASQQGIIVRPVYVAGWLAGWLANRCLGRLKNCFAGRHETRKMSLLLLQCVVDKSAWSTGQTGVG